MNLLRLMGDFTQLRREFRELASSSAAEEEEAKYELTASARRFSRRTKHVVDDKLSFSATLMRAGEVHAANRLLEEVEEDVRTEEAALIEKMNEVKVARATRRERMTRVRLARMLAVSLAGSLIMGFSALGMAAAGFVDQREQDQIRHNVNAQKRALAGNGVSDQAKRKLKGLDREVRKLLLADLPAGAIAALSPTEIRRFDALTNGTVDVGQLRSFLAEVLPTPDLALEVAAKIVDRVHDSVASAEKAVDDASALASAPRVKRKVQRAEDETTSEEAAAEEPEPSPSPDETQTPPEEEETTERDGRQQETGGDGDGDGDGGNGNGGEGTGGLPGAGAGKLPIGD